MTTERHDIDLKQWGGASAAGGGCEFDGDEVKALPVAA
jgi:hypothetical protein